MLANTPADEILVVIAAVLLGAEAYALWMVQTTRRRLGGGPGDYLLRVVMRFGVLVVIAQLLTVVNAMFRLVDSGSLGDIRLLMFIIIESIFAVAFLWTVWEIHHLPADRHGLKNTPAERLKPDECICVQIDNPDPLAGADVNQYDDDTPVAPI